MDGAVFGTLFLLLIKVLRQGSGKRGSQIGMPAVAAEEQSCFLHRVLYVQGIYVPQHLGSVPYPPTDDFFLRRIKRVEAHKGQVRKRQVGGRRVRSLGYRAGHHAFVAQPKLLKEGAEGVVDTIEYVPKRKKRLLGAREVAFRLVGKALPELGN